MTDRITVKELRELLMNFEDDDIVRIHVMGNIADAWLTVGVNEREIIAVSED